MLKSLQLPKVPGLRDPRLEGMDSQRAAVSLLPGTAPPGVEPHCGHLAKQSRTCGCPMSCLALLQSGEDLASSVSFLLSLVLVRFADGAHGLSSSALPAIGTQRSWRGLFFKPLYKHDLFCNNSSSGSVLKGMMALDLRSSETAQSSLNSSPPAIN